MAQATALILIESFITALSALLMKAGFTGFKSSRSVRLRRYLCAVNSPPCRCQGAGGKACFPGFYPHVERNQCFFMTMKIGYSSPPPHDDLKRGFHINLLNKGWRHLYYISLTD